MERSPDGSRCSLSREIYHYDDDRVEQAVKSSYDALSPNERLAITRIVMPYGNLTRIPACLFALTNVDMIVFYEQRLGVVPSEITSFSLLTHLYLNHNALESLPVQISSLRHLTVLRIHVNRLKWLPPTMKRLESLQILSLYGNPRLPAFCQSRTEIPRVLDEIATHFAYRGARAAVHCLMLAKQFDKGSAFARAMHTDVLRNIIAPMVWASRADDEWRGADEELRVVEK